MYKMFCMLDITFLKIRLDIVSPRSFHLEEGSSWLLEDGGA